MVKIKQHWDTFKLVFMQQSKEMKENKDSNIFYNKGHAGST